MGRPAVPTECKFSEKNLQYTRQNQTPEGTLSILPDLLPQRPLGAVKEDTQPYINAIFVRKHLENRNRKPYFNPSSKILSESALKDQMSTLCLQLEDKDKNYDNNDNDACSSKIQSDGGTNYSSWLTVASASVHQVLSPSRELYLLLKII